METKSKALEEATALKQSVRNQKLAISEIQERMASLEVSINTDAVIPATLSTAFDVSVAFHIAVNDKRTECLKY